MFQMRGPRSLLACLTPMVWDVMLIKLDALPEEDAELDPQPMGHPAIVSRRITKAWPGIRWRGVEGRVEQGDCVFDVEVSCDDSPVVGNATSVHVRVRGSGEPLPFLQSLCESNGWFAFDSQGGEFLDLEAPSPPSWQEVRGVDDPTGDAKKRRKPDSHRKMVAVGRPRRREIVFSLGVSLESSPERASDGVPPPLGDAGAIRARIARILTHVEWSSRGGVFDDGTTSFEVQLAAHGWVDKLACEIAGPRADEIIDALSRSYGWVAHETSGPIADPVRPLRKDR